MEEQCLWGKPRIEIIVNSKVDFRSWRSYLLFAHQHSYTYAHSCGYVKTQANNQVTSKSHQSLFSTHNTWCGSLCVWRAVRSGVTGKSHTAGWFIVWVKYVVTQVSQPNGNEHILEIYLSLAPGCSPICNIWISFVCICYSLNICILWSSYIYIYHLLRSWSCSKMQPKRGLLTLLLNS